MLGVGGHLGPALLAQQVLLLGGGEWSVGKLWATNGGVQVIQENLILRQYGTYGKCRHDGNRRWHGLPPNTTSLPPTLQKKIAPVERKRHKGSAVRSDDRRRLAKSIYLLSLDSIRGNILNRYASLLTSRQS